MTTSSAQALFTLDEDGEIDKQPATLTGRWFRDPTPPSPGGLEGVRNPEWIAWAKAYKPWWPPQCRWCDRKLRAHPGNGSHSAGWTAAVCTPCLDRQARDAYAAAPFEECGIHHTAPYDRDQHWQVCFSGICPCCGVDEAQGGRFGQHAGGRVELLHNPYYAGDLCMWLDGRRRDCVIAFLGPDSVPGGWHSGFRNAVEEYAS